MVPTAVNTFYGMLQGVFMEQFRHLEEYFAIVLAVSKLLTTKISQRVGDKWGYFDFLKKQR